MCEHYISHGLCTDFPDWSIAAAGSETNVKIGYDYGRSVTGQDDQLEPDLSEEATNTESDQLVPDPQEERSMVATSAEVCIYLFFVSDCHSLDFYFVLLFKKCNLSCCVCVFRHYRSSVLTQSTSLMTHHPCLSLLTSVCRKTSVHLQTPVYLNHTVYLNNTVSTVMLHCTV